MGKDKLSESHRWFKDSQTAWENINELFLYHTDTSHVFCHRGGGTYLYDVVFGIRNPKLDPEFDFGRHFNYHKAKWNQLVSNYINSEDLKSLKSQIQDIRDTNNISLQFDNTHKSGKRCLLSMVVSKRNGIFNLSIFLRASEITKRLIFDFLLIQRIGEYLFDGDKFTVVFHINQLFNDDVVLLMYHAHRSILDPLKEKKDKRSRELLEKLNKLLEGDPYKIKYKIHRRVAKVLRPDIFKYPKTLAKECKLNLPL